MATTTSITPIIYGNRIVLRPIHATDRTIFETARNAEFLKMVGADQNDAKVMRNEFEEYLSKPLHWAVTIQKGPCIGSAFIHSWVKSDERARYAVGIFDSNYWNKGYGTEITRLILNYAFAQLHLHRLDVRVLEYNVRAIRCYEKCGFICEGIERESAFVDGRRHNDIMMGILDHEYRRSD